MNLDILIFIVMFLVLVYLGLLHWWRAKKRTEAMGDVARQLGFSFSQTPVDFQLSSMHDLPSSSFSLIGFNSPKCRNLMKGGYQRRSWNIFDYNYSRGRNAISLTVFEADTKKLIPEFHLSPKNFLHFFSDLVGYKDIEFASNPVFSKRFVLHGKNEHEIRSLFKSEVMSFMEQMGNFFMFSDGKSITLYKEGTRFRPEEIRAVLESISMLLQKMDA
jgi:hypothetical protein